MCMETLSRQLEYYKAHQEEFLRDYEGKALLIHNEQLVNAFDSRTDAYQYGKRNFKPGTFFIIRCTPGDSEYTMSYTSRYIPPKEAAYEA